MMVMPMAKRKGERVNVVMGQCNDYGGCDGACKIARLVKASAVVCGLWSVVCGDECSGGWWLVVGECCR